MVVFLSSKLSQPARRQLAKLGELLGGRMADTFSNSGSAFLVQFSSSSVFPTRRLGALVPDDSDSAD